MKDETVMKNNLNNCFFIKYNQAFRKLGLKSRMYLKFWFNYTIKINIAEFNKD